MQLPDQAQGILDQAPALLRHGIPRLASWRNTCLKRDRISIDRWRHHRLFHCTSRKCLQTEAVERRYRRISQSASEKPRSSEDICTEKVPHPSHGIGYFFVSFCISGVAMACALLCLIRSSVLLRHFDPFPIDLSQTLIGTHFCCTFDGNDDDATAGWFGISTHRRDRQIA